MKMILGGAAVAIVAAVAFVGYSIFRPPAEASAPISAAPVTQATATTAAQATVFEIDQSESTAKFIIDEVLRGSPYTVVGTTNQVAGQIAANLENLDAAQVGEIRINARTLTTDSEGRNRMLQNRILETGEHEYITFTPTRTSGLPETVTVGQQFTFQMTGDLTIKGTSRETTFDVTVTPTADDRLEGTARATIAYADWGVAIPQVPSVTGVSDQLSLELNFVATDA